MKLLRETEAQFQRAVIELAQLFGWMAFHARPARRADGSWVTAVAGDGVGYPDLTLAKPGGFLLAELKAEAGRLSKPQERWLEVLRLAGVEVHVWRPSHWTAIEERLRGGA